MWPQMGSGAFSRGRESNPAHPWPQLSAFCFFTAIVPNTRDFHGRPQNSYDLGCCPRMPPGRMEALHPSNHTKPLLAGDQLPPSAPACPLHGARPHLPLRADTTSEHGYGAIHLQSPTRPGPNDLTTGPHGHVTERAGVA